MVRICQSLLQDPPEMSLMKPALPLSMSVSSRCWETPSACAESVLLSRATCANSHGVPTELELARIRWTSLSSSSLQTTWCFSGLPALLYCSSHAAGVMPSQLSLKQGTFARPPVPCLVPEASFLLLAP